MNSQLQPLTFYYAYCVCMQSLFHLHIVFYKLLRNYLQNMAQLYQLYYTDI